MIPFMKLKSAEGAINGAWLTGFIVGVLALIRTIIALIFSGPDSRWSAALTFADVVVLFALAYGVWRKSRACAVLLSAYFVYLTALKTVLWIRSGVVPPGILLDAVALLICLNGVRGVFGYHKIEQTTGQPV
jgi:hypothetical protein